MTEMEKAHVVVNMLIDVVDKQNVLLRVVSSILESFYDKMTDDERPSAAKALDRLNATMNTSDTLLKEIKNIWKGPAQ